MLFMREGWLEFLEFKNEICNTSNCYECRCNDKLIVNISSAYMWRAGWCVAENLDNLCMKRYHVLSRGRCAVKFMNLDSLACRVRRASCGYRHPNGINIGSRNPITFVLKDNH